MAMEWGVKVKYNKLLLKDIALRRVATLLCSQPNVYMFVVRMKNECKAKQETAIDSMSKEILAEISLPASTKEELASIMKPLLIEVIKWLYFHEKFLSFKNANLSNIDVLELICWERYDVGIVNYQETAKALIRHEKLDLDQRYWLACLYCLEPYARDLLEKLPVKSQQSLRNYPAPAIESIIVNLFTWYVRGEINELYSSFSPKCRRRYSSFYQCAFEMTAYPGYKTATQYFFEKLTSEEKEVSLVRIALVVAAERSVDECTYLHEYQKFSDVLCCLLTLMTKEQVMQVLQSYPFETLKCFLDWPRQDVFLEVATLAFPYLSKKEYSRLLFILSRNISSGYNNSTVFRDFLLISPRQLKLSLSLTRYGHILREFFRIGDVETIKFIFKNLEAAKIVKLALSTAGRRLCFNLVKQGKRRCLELFFREVKLSKEDKERFVASFSKHHAKLLSNRGKWQWFPKLIYEVDADCKVR